MLVGCCSPIVCVPPLILLSTYNMFLDTSHLTTVPSNTNCMNVGLFTPRSDASPETPEAHMNYPYPYIGKSIDVTVLQLTSGRSRI